MGEFEQLLDEYTTKEEIDWSQMEKGETNQYDGLMDLHIHSKGSFDGMERVTKIIKMARNNGVKTIAITDHNTMSAIKDYFEDNGYDTNSVYADVDGVKVVAGTEITCKIDVPNCKGNDLKLHLLVYGADMENSPLARLLEIKAANDFAFDFGMPIHCLKKMGLITNAQQELEWKKRLKEFIIEERKSRPGINEMTRELTSKFLEQQPINIAKSNRELCEMLADYNMVARLNLKVEDIIECAHASGGICVLAHPAVNLVRAMPDNREKTIKILLGMGIDGFEIMCNSSDPKYNDMIKSACNKYKGSKQDKKKILYTAGSDFHNTLNNKIGYVNYKDPIQRASFRNILDAIESLQLARVSESKNGKNFNSERIGRILKHYMDENALCISGTVDAEIFQDMKEYKKQKKIANNRLGMASTQIKKGKKKKHPKMKDVCADDEYNM